VGKVWKNTINHDFTPFLSKRGGGEGKNVFLNQQIDMLLDYSGSMKGQKETIQRNIVYSIGSIVHKDRGNFSVYAYREGALRDTILEECIRSGKTNTNGGWTNGSHNELCFGLGRLIADKKNANENGLAERLLITSDGDFGNYTFFKEQIAPSLSRYRKIVFVGILNRDIQKEVGSLFDNDVPANVDVVRVDNLQQLTGNKLTEIMQKLC
jgi:hypothetical protein